MVIDNNGIQYKKCSKCGEVKLITAFSTSSSSSDGYQYYCRVCGSKCHGKQHKKDELSIEEIRKEVSYNKDTGEFTGNIVPYIDNHNYYAATIHKVRCALHRIAWLLSYDEWPEFIDHINGNTLDNRLCNLRNCNNRENQLNQYRHRNSSCMYGAHYRKDSNVWRSQVTTEGNKRITLGNFTTQREASLVACKYLLEHNLVRREFIPSTFTDEELNIKEQKND